MPKPSPKHELAPGDRYHALPAKTRAFLETAGYGSPEVLPHIPDRKILSIPGIKKHELAAIRKLFPKEGHVPNAPVHMNRYQELGRTLPEKKDRARPRELRTTFQELLSLTLGETIRRLQTIESGLPAFDDMTKEEIIDWIRCQPGITLDTRDLKGLLDVAGKYGIGVRHVHAGDEEEPIQIRVLAAHVPLQAAG